MDNCRQANIGCIYEVKNLHNNIEHSNFPKLFLVYNLNNQLF